MEREMFGQSVAWTGGIDTRSHHTQDDIIIYITCLYDSTSFIASCFFTLAVRFMLMHEAMRSDLYNMRYLCVEVVVSGSVGA